MNRLCICLFLVFALSACASSVSAPAPAPSSAPQPTCLIALEQKNPPPLSQEAQAQGIGQRWSPVSGDIFKEDGATVTYAGVKISFGVEGYVAKTGSQTATAKAAKEESVELALSCGNMTIRVFLKYDGSRWHSLEYFKKEGSQA